MDPVTGIIILTVGVSAVQAADALEKALNEAYNIITYNLVETGGDALNECLKATRPGNDNAAGHAEDSVVSPASNLLLIDHIDVGQLRKCWGSKSNLTMAESFALLWQNDVDGSVSMENDTRYPYSCLANLVAAHIIDLLLLGYIKLVKDTQKDKYRIVALTKLQKPQQDKIIVSLFPFKMRRAKDKVDQETIIANADDIFAAEHEEETSSASAANYSNRCKATEVILEVLQLEQDRRYKSKGGKGSPFIGLKEFMSSLFNKEVLLDFIKKDIFVNLIQRGILTEDKRKLGLLGFKAGILKVRKESVYPTIDEDPEKMLVAELQEFRDTLLQNRSDVALTGSTVCREVLLKLLAHLPNNQELVGPYSSVVAPRTKHTLLPVKASSPDVSSSSPFVLGAEQSERFQQRIQTNELV